MSKIVMLSDTHNLHDFIVVPDGDILLHSGDATMLGTEHELEEFIRWLGKQPHKHKIWVAGNHDWGMETDINAYFKFFNKRGRKLGDLDTIRTHILQLCEELGVTYLNNSGVTVEGLNIWGSPDQPAFCGWAFNRSNAFLREHWKTIPDDTNILITHSPPHGFLDYLQDGSHVGDHELAERIQTLPNLELILSGHLHAAYGMMQVRDVIHVNAAILDDSYKIRNKPIEVEL